jgi:DNA-binding NarL/FixJ family response regulator
MNPFAEMLRPIVNRPGDGYYESRRVVHVGPRRYHQPIANPWGLSALEAQVAKRLCTMSTAHIGRDLGIADGTVKTMVVRASEKMEVRGRNAVAMKWAEHFEKKQ